MARKSGFVRRNNVMRRETLWVGIAAVDTALAAASTAVLFAGFSAAALALRPFTVIRTHIALFFWSDQVGASETYQMAYGHAVVSDQVLAIGVTAVPIPMTDLSSDLWFVHQIVAGRFVFITGAGVLQVGEQHFIDSKAMRKVEEGQDVASVIETSSVSSGANVLKSGRMLIKLH